MVVRSAENCEWNALRPSSKLRVDSHGLSTMRDRQAGREQPAISPKSLQVAGLVVHDLELDRGGADLAAELVFDREL